VNEEVRRLKAQWNKDREEAMHARVIGGTTLEEWWQKMEER
jgi:hypothetical protein